MRLPPFLVEKNPPVDQRNEFALNRRDFMRQLCSSSVLATVTVGMIGCSSIDQNNSAAPTVDFQHGVASGDPLSDRVILWTRVTPHVFNEGRDVSVRWEMANDKAMRDIVVSGQMITDATKDYTVKVDVPGLMPGRVYFYRFIAAASVSPIGRTKTLPGADVAQVKFAVFCCANFPAGYFNVYADAAGQSDLDVALHIGDYIYEYESNGYACDKAVALGRVSEPKNLLLVLDDYRRRYAQYRTDGDLQAVHAALPFITVWDDHEFADDAWRDGSEDHKAREQGPFSRRKAVAVQAYHEWMPTRLPDANNPGKIYRSFDFGKIASLHMLDTRIVGRDQQIMMSSYIDDDEKLNAKKFKADVASPRRQLLGQEQMAWLDRSVGSSKAAWQIIGQQVLMARMEYPTPVAMGDISCAAYVDLKTLAGKDPSCITREQKTMLSSPTLPCYLDSWDGYQSDREKVFDIMRRHDKNMVVLAGDTHNAWASDLLDNMQRQIGVEFAASSVSSPGLEGSYPNEDPDKIARMMEQLIGPLYYAQTSKRGYMIITASEKEVRADWHFVNTVQNRKFVATTDRSLRTVAGAGNRRIVEA